MADQNLNYLFNKYLESVVVEVENKYVKFNMFEDFGEIDDYLEIISKLETLSNKYNVVVVDINSNGGLVQTMIHLINVLRKYDLIVTINSGVCYSAGFILWCLGDIKVTYPYSGFMWHRESWGVIDKANSQKRLVEYNNKVHELLIQKLISEVLTDEQIKLGEETEVWFLGQDLLDSGVAVDADKFDINAIFSSKTTSCLELCNHLILNKGGKYEVYEKRCIEDGLSFKEMIFKTISDDFQVIDDKPNIEINIEEKTSKVKNNKKNIDKNKK